MVVLTTTTWYGEQAVDGVYRHHIMILSQHCINITIIVYLCELQTSSNKYCQDIRSYDTYTLPCSTPSVSCGCIDTKPLEFDLGSMQLGTELFATNKFQHDKSLPADTVDCHALFLKWKRDMSITVWPIEARVTLVHRGVTLDMENSHPRHQENWNMHHPRHHATFQVGITADWLPITTWNSAPMFLVPVTITSISMGLQ